MTDQLTLCVRVCVCLVFGFQAFQTQKSVEQEARALQVQASKFSKQTSQWMATITTFDNALKELGDFENYVRTLEWEIQTVSDALERITTTTEEARSAGAKSKDNEAQAQ